MIASFFDINTVFFTLWDYPMSYLEFFGTLLNILTVWLCARKNIWNWPLGIVAVILFAALFYQIHLYSDLLEQVYYLVTGFWGWWMWSAIGKGVDGDRRERAVSSLSRAKVGVTLLVLLFGTLALGWFMARIHIFFPNIFMEPASFPYLDAFTTVASFAAQALLIFKKIENWYLWIMVDIIGVWLYSAKEVKFVALLYGIFLVLAISGLLAWKKELRQARRGNDTREGVLLGEEVHAI